MTSRHVVLSGCSGSGKSTLLSALGRRGWDVVPEPGRRIVEEEQRGDGRALPWVDLAAFAMRGIEVAAEDRRRMRGADGWVFFDRGLVDAAVALEHATGRAARDLLAGFDRYHRLVFLTPPWPEIYRTDGERRHDLAAAVAEYERLLKAYRELGYETVVLPKVTVEECVDLVLDRLGR